MKKTTLLFLALSGTILSGCESEVPAGPTPPPAPGGDQTGGGNNNDGPKYQVDQPLAAS